MKRLVYDYLLDWTGRKDHKPLILRGARQTGKTWLVQQLATRFPGGIAHVNLERDPDLAPLFRSNDPKHTLSLLETRLRKGLVPGQCLLFLDEVQAAPEVLGKLRWFAEELPALHVVAAGSLLDFALADPAFSMPVGRITLGHLEPMTFAEFLLAMGEDRLVDALRNAKLHSGVDGALHERLLDLVRTHTLIGGMPAAVASWIEHRSFARVAEIHRDLRAPVKTGEVVVNERVIQRRSSEPLWPRVMRLRRSRGRR